MKVAIFTSVFALFSGLVSSAAIPTAETDTSIVKARTVATYFPDLMIPIFEDDPDYAIKSSTWGEVSRVSWTDSAPNFQSPQLVSSFNSLTNFLL